LPASKLSGEYSNINPAEIRYESATNRVWVNDNIYLNNVPENVWQFRFGGHNPLQEWLIKHRNQIFDNAKIEILGKIVVAISETLNLQKTINDSL
jgi:hypothetical protein